MSFLEKNDWSLTPRRYVGVSQVIDEDFDFEARDILIPKLIIYAYNTEKLGVNSTFGRKTEREVVLVKTKL